MTIQRSGQLLMTEQMFNVDRVQTISVDNKICRDSVIDLNASSAFLTTDKHIMLVDNKRLDLCHKSTTRARILATIIGIAICASSCVKLMQKCLLILSFNIFLTFSFC